MDIEAEAAAEGGEQTFEQEFETAREAEAPQIEDAEAEVPEAKAEEKPPLPPEELQKRLNDQQGATRAERARRREAEQRAQQLEQRLAALEQRSTTPKAEPGARPDPEEDPIGYLQYVEGRLQEQEAKDAADAQRQQAQREGQRQVQAVIDRVAEHENDFRELHPDYDEAAEHLYQAKKAEYLDSGYEEGEAHSMVMAEFLTRSQRAFAARKDPAEIVYSLAKKAGFAPKTGETKLAAIEEGQKRQSPLSGAGAGGSGELTMEAVSKLSGAAFDSAFVKLQERARTIERQTGY